MLIKKKAIFKTNIFCSYVYFWVIWKCILSKTIVSGNILLLSFHPFNSFVFIFLLNEANINFFVLYIILNNFKDSICYENTFCFWFELQIMPQSFKDNFDINFRCLFVTHAIWHHVLHWPSCSGHNFSQLIISTNSDHAEKRTICSKHPLEHTRNHTTASAIFFYI